MTPRPLVLFFVAALLLPDEGQWSPTQVREMDWEALQKRGMLMTKDEFWHPEHGGLLSAAVQINNCSAAFVSKDGLLLTNHHCGFSAISELSTPEQNWLRDGFAAPERVAELPAKGMVASVLKRIEDVTARVHAAQAEATDDLDRWARTQQVIAAIVKEGEQKEAATKCSVASFLEGKEYHLYYRTQITDLRLVYAPPRAIGEFGGEVDNWEWPRHTGDFCFFRAWVGPNGEPREYHPDNVPYQPRHFLAVSTEGVQEGDLALILGYPARTQRYKTSRGVATQLGYVYPHRVDVTSQALEVLEAAAKKDEAHALAVADRIKSIANIKKNAAGMVFGLRNNATVAKKTREEALFREFAQKPGNAAWSTVLDEMLAIDEAEATTIERDTLMSLFGMLSPDLPLVAALVEACGAVAGGEPLPSRLAKLLASDGLNADFELIQKPLAMIVLAEIASMSTQQRPPGIAFLGDDAYDTDALGRAFAGTTMLDATARTELFKKGNEAVASTSDPLVMVARVLAAERAAAVKRAQQRAGKMLDVGRRWVAAQEAFRGKSFYPDANNTLRVSIATVTGYSPRDGVAYVPHTTVAGILQKETGKAPFASPKLLLRVADNRLQSRWVDKRLRDVPVCFLTNGDTTGGNSGSPVIDGKGHLIGLNFDRVYEAVAGDFGWSAELSRNIVLDVRYVLWILESVYTCPVLLKELLQIRD